MEDNDAQSQLKKRARRRLVGAVAFASVVAVVLPMIMDHQPRQAVTEVEIRIPGQDEKPFAPKFAVTPVEKAIRSAGLGLNPINDGNTLRLPIPDLTEERRKELAKLAHTYAEKARIAIRNVRRDGMDNLKADENKKEISEDDRKRGETEVQKLTDEIIKEADAIAAQKEQEILGK